MDNQKIRTRFEAQWSARKIIEYTWNLVGRFVVPLRTDDFFQEQWTEHAVRWDRPRRDVYDSEAILAAENLAASVHSGLTSSLVRWFNIQFRNTELNQNNEAKVWLEVVADIMWEAMRESNLDLEIGETYLDLTTFGTSPFSEEVIEKGGSFDALEFKSVPIRETYFEMTHRNQPLRFYRLLRMLPLQIQEQFGRDKVPDYINDKADAADSTTERQDVIYCVYERPEFQDADRSTTIPKERRPFGEKYIMRKDAALLGEEGGYYDMPIALPRWRKSNVSAWGYSPAMVVLGNILQLNDTVSMESDALEKNIDPTMFVTQRGLVSRRDLRAGGITVLRNLEDYRFLERNIDVSWVYRRVDMLQSMIRRAFYVDQLELKESPAMTATEVNVRYELMQRLLGPTFGRLKSDLLDKIVERTYGIMYRAGQFPKTPQIVLDNQAQLDIEYTGPMARAQKAERVGAIERFGTNIVQLANGIAPLAPQKAQELLDYVDTDKVPKELADLLGIPADMLPSDGDIEKKRGERQQQEAQAQQIATAQGTGDAMQAVGQGAQSLQVVEGGGA